MATQQEITDGIAREKLFAAKELAHFTSQKATTKAFGHCAVAIVTDSKDGRSSIKTTAIERAVRAIEAKGFQLPQNMNFFFSAHQFVRCVAFMSDPAVPDVFLGWKICQLNPLQPHVATTITGGLGAQGTRGVSSQVYDATRGNLFGIGDPKLKAQATAIVVHELGHVLHSQLSPSLFWDCKGGDAKLGVGWDTLSTGVSHYATQNALEFVAETFTATVVGGRQFNQAVKTAYAALGGPTTATFWN
jgi:hypothetical protein